MLRCGGGAFAWEELTGRTQGEPPPPRFDHTAYAFPITPNSETYDKLVIMGGRDVGAVLSDAHTLDLATLTWERAPDGSATGVPVPGGEVCCAAVEDVESVPYHKVSRWGETDRRVPGTFQTARAAGALQALLAPQPVVREHRCRPQPCRNQQRNCVPRLVHAVLQVFTFGGKRGMMSYVNSVEVMDCGSRVWSTPPLEAGCKAPIGRWAQLCQVPRAWPPAHDTQGGACHAAHCGTHAAHARPWCGACTA